MNVARLIFPLALAAIGVASCQIVAGLDGDYVAAPEPDGGADAGADADPGACVAATYPDPPTIADDAASEEIVLALRTIDLGENAVIPPGYDLDHTCTCFADAGPSCVSPKPHCDFNGGIDSASAQFFNLVRFAAGPSAFSSDSFSARANEGRWSFLLRIRGYNGKADDPHVEVALFPSPGVEKTVTLHWDGTDAWPVSAQGVVNDDPEQPTYPAQGAYVAAGTLVIAAPSVLMRLGGDADTIGVQFTGAVLTGKLTKESSGWRLSDGILAGRWQIGNIFQAIASYRDGNGQPICTDAALTYTSVKSTICNGLDILADPTGAKNLPCDALSIGIGFGAQQAKMGAIAPPPTPTPGCPPETDPAMDTCPQN